MGLGKVKFWVYFLFQNSRWTIMSLYSCMESGLIFILFFFCGRGRREGRGGRGERREWREGKGRVGEGRGREEKKLKGGGRGWEGRGQECSGDVNIGIGSGTPRYP